MTEHPILFSTPMVQAILAGRKTMTRRVIKPQAHHYTGDALGQPQIYPCNAIGDADPTAIKCPYGVVGDRLWVRETFFDNSFDGERLPADEQRWYYRADGEMNKQFEDVEGFTGWKPSIYMPRHASRITLEIVKICVKQLQEITESNIEQEGVELDTINGKKYPWTRNPWVWVIEFKRLVL